MAPDGPLERTGGWSSSPNTRTRDAGWEKRLAEALDDLQPDDRISSFTGATAAGSPRGT